MRRLGVRYVAAGRPPAGGRAERPGHVPRARSGRAGGAQSGIPWGAGRVRPVVLPATAQFVRGGADAGRGYRRGALQRLGIGRNQPAGNPGRKGDPCSHSRDAWSRAEISSRIVGCHGVTRGKGRRGTHLLLRRGGLFYSPVPVIIDVIFRQRGSHAPTKSFSGRCGFRSPQYTGPQVVIRPARLCQGTSMPDPVAPPDGRKGSNGDQKGTAIQQENIHEAFVPIYERKRQTSYPGAPPSGIPGQLLA